MESKVQQSLMTHSPSTNGRSVMCKVNMLIIVFQFSSGVDSGELKSVRESVGQWSRGEASSEASGPSTSHSSTRRGPIGPALGPPRVCF